MEAEWVEIGSVKEWADNPRKNDKAVGPVAESIRRFGWGSPILVRRSSGVIVAGHTRYKAAKKLGLDKVLVRFLDIDEDQAKALALADNRLGEIAQWDDAALNKVISELAAKKIDLTGVGWREADLVRRLASMGGGVEPEVPVRPEPVSRAGELYELGPHRLLCGSSTDAESWDRVLGGDRVALVWTDPPYGVAYVGKTADALTIENDALDPDALQAFLGSALGNLAERCVPGAAWYVASPAGSLFDEFAAVLGRRGLDIWKHTLIWVKSTIVMGRSDYHYQHEPIFYGWTKGSHFFTDDRKTSSVLRFDKPQRNGEHPTMKPIELVEHCIINSSKPGDIVADAFGGSGTTLLAAARQGRVARLIELDPKYCDVIRRRWTRWAIEHNQDPGPGALDG